MDFNFKITDEARPYLILQKGALDNLKEDQAAWDAAYNKSINNTFKTIEPFLPEKCTSVLDVGSGMGGINALINRHYGGKVLVNLLDGVDDEPLVKTHSQTFNNIQAAYRFLRENGVSEIMHTDPNLLERYHDIYENDLILSFGAWCFHFPPSDYLNFVVKRCKPGTVLILDVRRNKPEWLADLTYALGPSEIIRSTIKFNKRKFVYAG